MDQEQSFEQPMISASTAVDVANLLRQEGIDPLPVFDAAEISLKATEDPYQMVHLYKFTRLLDLAANLAGHALLGLVLGYRQNPAKWGAYGYVVMNSPTIGSGLRNLAKFLKAVQGGTHIAFVVQGDYMGIEYSIVHPGVGHKAQDAEFTIAYVRHMVDFLNGRTVDPVSVQFEHTPLGDRADYSKILTVSPHFGQPINCIMYPRALEDKQVVSADLQLYPIVRQHLQDITSATPDRHDLIATVKYHIRQSLPRRQCSLEHIAGTLAVGPRSLQRRLKDEGTSFVKMVAEIRRGLALEHLVNSSMEVKEISYLLGYYDPSAFIKAFKAWTGLTPSLHRERGAAHRDIN